ncbi:unnamed protein product [Closterium sp. NIES-53]
MALALRSPCRAASTCIFLLATALFSSSDHFTQLSTADAAADSAEGGGGGGGGAAAISLPESLSSYSNVALLDPRLELHWTVNDSDATIRLAVRANTAGWLAIGISEIGSMVGSDVLVAWVAEKEGRVYATDCFIFNTSTEPTLDSNQDWHVLGGSQTTNQSTGDTWTTVHVWRRLDTGDCNDRPIISGKLHNIIWATGPTDDVSYHGSTRGGAALVLAPTPGPTILEPPQPPSTASAAAVFKSIRGSGRLAVQQKAVGGEEAEARVLEFTVKDYPVPMDRSSYRCMVRPCNVPPCTARPNCASVIDAPLESKQHAVEWGPVINTTHVSSLHHAFLYGCSSSIAVVLFVISLQPHTHRCSTTLYPKSKIHSCGATTTCLSPHLTSSHLFPPLLTASHIPLPNSEEYPDLLPAGMVFDCVGRAPCSTFVAVWAWGGRPFTFPHNIGYPIGPGYFTKFVLEMHYANPEGRSDMIDSSGVYLKLVASPGFKDAHIMKVGMVDHTRLIRIPPAMPSWTHSNSCPGECTAAVFKNESVKIIGSILHEHNIGRQDIMLSPHAFTSCLHTIPAFLVAIPIPPVLGSPLQMYLNVLRGGRTATTINRIDY